MHKPSNRQCWIVMEQNCRAFKKTRLPQIEPLFHKTRTKNLKNSIPARMHQENIWRLRIIFKNFHVPGGTHSLTQRYTYKSHLIVTVRKHANVIILYQIARH